MYDKNIEDLVSEYISFSHGINVKGWSKVFCEVCGDGTHAKGPRGGWLFSDEMCFYHCFNCGVDGNFDPNRDIPFSRDMRKIFNAFGIPENEYNAIAYSKKVLSDNKATVPKKQKAIITPIEMPDFFILLQKASKENVVAKKAYKELEYRNISPDDYPFFLSNGISKKGPRDQALAKSFVDRLIIPFFDDKNNLIYYQGRALDKSAKTKYINADTPKTNIIYGMHRLHINHDKPLYITEGFFDAYHLKGISVQENHLTNGQIEIINKSRRKKIFVPDRKSDSSRIVDQCAELGWAISVPDIGSSCKDIDDAIRKYGKLYTLQQVASNIYDNAKDAKLLMKLNGYLIK